jgi:fatty acid desaturase (delta-4 desaturase)
MPPVPPEAESNTTKSLSTKQVESDLKSLTETTVQVDDKLYDAKTLSSIHPGGDIFVKAFAGRDATEAFLSYHRRTFPHSKMAEHLVGNTKSNRNAANDDKEYLELCQRIDEVLPRNQSFAPFSYYLKLIALVTLTVGLEGYIHYTGQYRWYLTGILGLFFAWVGMNIQHDANHGAISRYGAVNRILGLSQNWIGGSAIDWIHQHVVQHHIAPNDCEKDPDIVGNPLLRLNPLQPMLASQQFQHIYVFFLFMLFGLTYIGFATYHVLVGFHFSKMSKMVEDIRMREMFGFVFFFCRWIVTPLVRFPQLSTFLNILPMFIVGGYYLSFFFIISHNFEGVYLEENGAGVTKIANSANADQVAGKGMGFLRRQVATAGNVGGPVLGFFNGGLNYQIEHHLFPRIQHTHYPTIAPVVKKFCEEKGIPYIHFPTIGDNVMSCVRHLHQMGHSQYPSGFKAAGGKDKAQ